MAIGLNHLEQLKAMADLAPEHKVLDVGCGPGRTAIPLASYLSEEGVYEGFDVSVDAIEWCRDQISSRFPNFGFTCADVFNGGYNPYGRIRPTQFTFPYPDEYFDLVILYSVFTHMLPEDLEHYLSEIARVLKEGGTMIASFLLLSRQRLAELASIVSANPETGGGTAKHLLEHDLGACNAAYEVPEQVLAYKEDAVRSLWAKYGLQIKEPIFYGNWADWLLPGEFGGDQDVVQAYRSSEKAATPRPRVESDV
jgi:SAM-dependent methyltransferase